MLFAIVLRIYGVYSYKTKDLSDILFCLIKIGDLVRKMAMF